MEPADVLTRLTEVFRDVFDDPRLEINARTTAKDIDDWDSITHINLILAVEKAFKVSITTREVANLKEVGDLMQILVARGA
jgi:acyl carrier protein